MINTKIPCFLIYLILPQGVKWSMFKKLYVLSCEAKYAFLFHLVYKWIIYVNSNFILFIYYIKRNIKILSLEINIKYKSYLHSLQYLQAMGLSNFHTFSTNIFFAINKLLWFIHFYRYKLNIKKIRQKTLNITGLWSYSYPWYNVLSIIMIIFLRSNQSPMPFETYQI